MNPWHHWYCRSSHWRMTLESLVPWGLGDAELGDHVLEIGPGRGLVTRMLAARVSRVTALDIDPAAFVDRDLWSGRHGVAAVNGDAARLPFAAASFSAVVACNVLHHLESSDVQRRLFAEVRRALRPGGVFVGVDPRMSAALWLFHLGDTCTLIEPSAVPGMLGESGFGAIAVGLRRDYFRFAAIAREAPGADRLCP